MLDLYSLFHKNVKEVRQILTSNQIAVRSDRRCPVIFDYELLGKKFEVNVYFYQKKSYNLCLHRVIENRDSVGERLAFTQKFREFFEPEYGVPLFDSTNHPDEDLWIQYQKDQIYASINAGVIENATLYTVSIHKNLWDANNPPFKPKKSSALSRWGNYIFGGFMWGSAMNFVFGLSSGFTSVTFIACAIGAVAWTLLFGGIMERVAAKEAKGLEKSKKLKQKEFSQKELTALAEFEAKNCLKTYYDGAIESFRMRGNCQHKARFYLPDENSFPNDAGVAKPAERFTVVYFDKDELRSVVAVKQSLMRNLPYENICFFVPGDASYVFNPKQEEKAEFIGLLNQKCGYKSEKYEIFKQKMEKVFAEFDPLSVYKNGKTEELREPLNAITNEVFAEECPSEEKITEIIGRIMEMTEIGSTNTFCKLFAASINREINNIFE